MFNFQPSRSKLICRERSWPGSCAVRWHANQRCLGHLWRLRWQGIHRFWVRQGPRICRLLHFSWRPPYWDNKGAISWLSTMHPAVPHTTSCFSPANLCFLKSRFNMRSPKSNVTQPSDYIVSAPFHWVLESAAKPFYGNSVIYNGIYPQVGRNSRHLFSHPVSWL